MSCTDASAIMISDADIMSCHRHYIRVSCHYSTWIGSCGDTDFNWFLTILLNLRFEAEYWGDICHNLVNAFQILSACEIFVTSHTFNLCCYSYYILKINCVRPQNGTVGMYQPNTIWIHAAKYKIVNKIYVLFNVVRFQTYLLHGEIPSYIWQGAEKMSAI